MLLTPNPVAPSLSERLVLTIQGMCQAAARRGAKDWASSALLLLLWGRLQRMARRFEALAALVRAGQLSQEPHGERRDRPPRPPTPNRPQVLPGGFAWLLRLVPEVAAYGSQLQYLLTDPETAALLKAAPQAGRILRPLCHMLGIPPGPAALPRSHTKPDRELPQQPPTDAIETPIAAQRTPNPEPPPRNRHRPDQLDGPGSVGSSPTLPTGR